jgi:hypothetical protein
VVPGGLYSTKKDEGKEVRKEEAVGVGVGVGVGVRVEVASTVVGDNCDETKGKFGDETEWICGDGDCVWSLGGGVFV